MGWKNSQGMGGPQKFGKKKYVFRTFAIEQSCPVHNLHKEKYDKVVVSDW